MTLDQLPIGESAVITAVGGEGALRCRLLDMGLTPKTAVTIRKTAPMGDPIELHIRSYELTIRLDDARTITVCRHGEQFRGAGCGECPWREGCDSILPAHRTPHHHHPAGECERHGHHHHAGGRRR